MTHPPTSAPDTEPLDSFESALLTELRRQVVEQPVGAPVPPRRRRRRVLAAATAGLAASVVAVVGFGGAGGSPAYAVDVDNDGDVVVTVHRLDDAAGLEKALRARGIDADVSYDADLTDSPHTVGIGPDGEMLPPDALPPPSEGAVTEERGSTTSGGEDAEGHVTSSQGKPPPDDLCGLGASPADLSKQGGDWVLRIPAGSPLMDRPVQIGTDAQGSLSVLYGGNEPGSFCGVMQAQVPLQ